MRANYFAIIISQRVGVIGDLSVLPFSSLPPLLPSSMYRYGKVLLSNFVIVGGGRVAAHRASTLKAAANS